MIYENLMQLDVNVEFSGKVVSAPASNPEVMGSRLVAATIVGVCVLGQDT